MRNYFCNGKGGATVYEIQNEIKNGNRLFDDGAVAPVDGLLGNGRIVS